MSRIELIRSKLSNFSAHVSGVNDTAAATDTQVGDGRKNDPGW